jgi:PAS domain S-box-containing protein
MNAAGTQGALLGEPTGAPVEVLHVEDDESFARVARKFLERADESISLTSVTNPEVVLDRLAAGEFECVLSDYDMPEMSGIDLLSAVREEYPDLPFILFTGKGSEEVASDAFSAGATDYFQKSTDSNEYELLAERIHAAVEKYRTERRLERSEERYRRLVETAPVPIAVHRGDAIVFANDAAAEFLAVDDPGELLGEDPLEFLATDDRAVAAERVERLLAEEATADPLEETYVDSEGTEKQALVAGAGVSYEGARGVQVVVQDVTERRERERELERYRQLVETMGDGVYMLDAEGHIQMVNERAAELTGYSREELVGAHASMVMTEAGNEAAEAAIAELRRGEAAATTIQVMGERADGSTVPRQITLTLQPSEDGEFVGTVGVVHDITDRLERQRELEEAEEKFRKFFEHANDAVFIVDVAADEIRETNPAASDLLGYSREELRGMSPGAFHPDNLDRVVEFTERVVEQGHGSMEKVVCHGREEAVECEMSAAVCEIDGRRCIINSVRDVTEREERRRELERQNERLEAFAGALSHDLRSPLNVIRAELELARRDTPDESVETAAALAERLGAIESATDRIERLIDDVLTLAEQGATVGETQPVPLADLVATAWSELDTAGATLETTDLGTVVADPTRLHRLCSNLLRNAVEHARTDGTVTVTVRGRPDGFAVADDGPGIPPTEREAVFERGHTSGEGTGFGLAIVRTVAEAHGWTVSIDESEAGGTRIDVVTDPDGC